MTEMEKEIQKEVPIWKVALGLTVMYLGAVIVLVVMVELLVDGSVNY